MSHILEAHHSLPSDVSKLAILVAQTVSIRTECAVVTLEQLERAVSSHTTHHTQPHATLSTGLCHAPPRCLHPVRPRNVGMHVQCG